MKLRMRSKKPLKTKSERSRAVDRRHSAKPQGVKRR